MERAASVKEFCIAGWRLVKDRLTILASLALVIGLIGADPFQGYILHHLTLEKASKETVANAGSLLGHPLARLAFVFLALWLFGRAAKRVIEGDNARAARDAAIRQAALSEVRGLLAEFGRLPALMAACFLANRYSMQEAHDHSAALEVAKQYLEDINDLRIGKEPSRRIVPGAGGREAQASILDASADTLQRQLIDLYKELGRQWNFEPYKGTIVYEEPQGDALPSKGGRDYDPEKNREFFAKHTDNYRKFWDGLGVIDAEIDARWRRTRELLEEVEKEADRLAK